MTTTYFHTPSVRRLLVLLAAPAAVAIPAGTAFANSFTADADCAGVTFQMPRGEAGTVVTATVDGRLVARVTVATHGDTVLISQPSPDRTVAHTYVITVDSRFNTDQSWSETVAACSPPVASTSTTLPVASTTTSTVPPSPSSTVTPSTTVPPTVVTTPRPTPGSTVPPTSVPFRLPDTGAPTDAIAFVAATWIAAGLTLLRIRRGGAK